MNNEQRECYRERGGGGESGERGTGMTGIGGGREHLLCFVLSGLRGDSESRTQSPEHSLYIPKCDSTAAGIFSLSCIFYSKRGGGGQTQSTQ